MLDEGVYTAVSEIGGTEMINKSYVSVARAFSGCAESTAVIRQYRLRQPRCRHAGTDLVGPAAADCAGGRGWQLDPRGRPPLCRQPIGRDQADAAGARDGECRP